MSDELRARDLDLCIHALIEGADWQPLVDRERAVELEPLMEVAARVLDDARHTPHAGFGRRFRIWNRVFHWRSGDAGAPVSRVQTDQPAPRPSPAPALARQRASPWRAWGLIGRWTEAK
ncbi:MAG: hypothetical protein HYX53_02090 [Chloroflexi bacterium]|nr:hypothetical protein [Chloroflexota bacterium]